MVTEYETTVVIRPDVNGDAVEATLDRVRDVVKSQGGKLLAINHWGKRKLAYEIEKHSRGIYVHTHYLGGGPLVAEIERHLRISDNVLRFLTVQLSKNVDAAERQATEYVRPQYDVEEAVAEEADVVAMGPAALRDEDEESADEAGDDDDNGDGIDDESEQERE